MNHDYGQCHVCGGRMVEQMTDQSVQDGTDWLLVRDVPAGVCDRCGEQVLRWEVTHRLEQIVKARGQMQPQVHLQIPVFAF